MSAMADLDSALRDALVRFDDARQLLGKEDDLDALWRAIVAADNLFNQVDVLLNGEDLNA